MDRARLSKILFMICWLAYFSAYLGRLNFSAAVPRMIELSLLTKSEVGMIGTLYFGCYGVGQFYNGILADRFPPQRLMMTGLLLAAITNIGMAIAPSFWAMAILWSINGYAQSMLWPLMIALFAKMMPSDLSLKYAIDMVSSQVVGSLGAYLMASICLTVFDWQSVFVCAGICLIVIAITFILGFNLLKKENFVEFTPHRQEPQLTSPIRLLLGLGVSTMIIPAIVHGIIKDGMTNWIPTYLTESFHLSVTMVGAMAMVIPIINLSGAYLAKFLYHQFGEKEMVVLKCFFGLSSFSLLGIFFWGKGSIGFSLLALAVATASMVGANTVLVNMIPMKFKKGNAVAKVSGFFNSMGYLGTAISMVVVGYLAGSYGWRLSIVFWMSLSLLAFMIVIIFKNQRFGFQ